MASITEEIRKFYNEKINSLIEFRYKNKYYYNFIEKILKFIVPKNKKVLDIGCGISDILKKLEVKEGMGIDIAEKLIEYNRALNKNSNIKYKTLDILTEPIDEKFDYILLINTIGDLEDVWQTFRNLKSNVSKDTRIVIIYFNYLWQPILKLGEKIGLKHKQKEQNWLNSEDLNNLLYLNGFEIIKYGYQCIFPYYIPYISDLINNILGNFPILHRLGLISFLVAKPYIEESKPDNEYTVSVIIPTKNERENIEGAVYRTPNMGRHTELIFVDGHSTDGTKERILELIDKEKGNKEIKFFEQDGIGKADAVWKGFDNAQGELLMILDSDLTVPPEDLMKFYKAIEEGKCDFVNGSRLVYKMEKEAMRTLNLLGNKFFAMAFSFILGQKLKDTLCGTKVLRKTDYLRIQEIKDYFGDFDPFGDFLLLFGAAKLNLKILEIPIRYKSRTYGEIKIDRFRHGWLLLKMVCFAFLKFGWKK